MKPMGTQKIIVSLWRQLVGSIARAGYRLIDFMSHKCGLRKRHILTRNNTLRIRYVFVTSILVLLAFATQAPIFKSTSIDGRNLDDFDVASLANIAPAYGSNEEEGSGFDDNLYGQFSVASVMTHNTPNDPRDIKKEKPLDRVVKINPGDALGVVMQKEGVGNSETSLMIKAMKAHYDPRHLKAGQEIAMHFDPAEARGAEPKFREMQIQLDPIKTLVVARAGDGFSADLQEKEVKRVVKAKEMQVEVSLYGSASKAGIPKGIVAEAIRIYSWNVDFQRDLRSKDKLEVMYESFETENGYVAKNGNILYAKLTLNNREIPLYRFEMKSGKVDYFGPDGRSIKRTLMKTPIDGARVSSGYGLRRHPVLGYRKMHKGVDFAAPTGTPIYAAGDGVIEKAGWFSSYGKYVRIRHNSKLKTAYAHMSKIKVKNGTRVKQGQVIGYVGTTGRSTGAHLHYEVLVNGAQTNPRSVKLPIGEELAGTDKANLNVLVKKRKQEFASAINKTKVATTEAPRRGFKSIFFN